MNNIKLIITIFLIVFLTTVIALFAPKLPKQIIITEGNYIFVEENSNAPVPVKTADTNATSAPITVTNNNNVKSVQNVKPSSVNINNVPVKTTNTSNVKTTPIKTSNTSNITTKSTVANKPAAVKTQSVTKNNPVQQQVKTTPKSVSKPVSKPAVSQSNNAEEQWRNQQAQKKAAQEKEQKAKAEQQAKEQAKQNSNYTAQRVLTEHEETIVWNKWRSDLQNKVMKDTNIGAPKGTGFRFSFTVDKFGNMSNINVWSTNPVYTDLAVRVIKPVLQSYQHQPILKFPAGTKRTITNVTGGFVMSSYTQYSKPSDFSDVEKVKLKY